MSDVTRRTGQSRGRAYTTDAARPQQHPQPEPSTEVVVPIGTAVTVSEYNEDAGAGMECVESSEMLIPFVRIVQPTAQVLKEASPSYDEHVKQGMMMNTALGTYYAKKFGFGFVPCFRSSSYTEWVPIDEGGGFRGTWAHDDQRVYALLKEQGAFKALKTGQGTELIETYTLYGVVVPREQETGVWLTEEAAAGVVAFTSTQIKKYKMLMTRLQALIGQPPRYPMFAWRWNFSTQPEKNKKGDFYGWDIRLAAETADAARLPATAALYHAAKELHGLVKSGAATADYATSDVSETAVGDGPARSGQTIDATANMEQEIPF